MVKFTRVGKKRHLDEVTQLKCHLLIDLPDKLNVLYRCSLICHGVTSQQTHHKLKMQLTLPHPWNITA
jgi:hypothetical protein